VVDAVGVLVVVVVLVGVLLGKVVLVLVGVFVGVSDGSGKQVPVAAKFTVSCAPEAKY